VEGYVAPVPMLGKLYLESSLYGRDDIARVNPITAMQEGLSDGARVVVSTNSGSGTPIVRLDPSVGPGLVQIHASPPLAGKSTAMQLCDGLALSNVELRRV
jgi:hypothetical protein